MLQDKSLTELRGIAQSFDIPDIFSKTATQLIQAIELKQVAKVAPPPIVIPQPEYDVRLMTGEINAMIEDEASVRDILKEHIARGLHISFDEPERWSMKFGIREDSGTMRMPLRTIRQCADKVLG